VPGTVVASKQLSRRPALYLLGWIGVGLLGALNLLLALSIPPALLITLPLTVVAARGLSTRSGPEWCKWGLAVGLAALPIFFAYSNRHGPGTYCHSIGSPRHPGEECGDYWDPRPWIVIAALLMLLAPLGAWWRARR